jgi:hypothetical protein
LKVREEEIPPGAPLPNATCTSLPDVLDALENA